MLKDAAVSAVDIGFGYMVGFITAASLYRPITCCVHNSVLHYLGARCNALQQQQQQLQQLHTAVKCR